MRIPPSAFVATALLSVVACSNPECLENEEKVGNTCYPVRTTTTADAGATASDSGPIGDGGAAVSKLDGSVKLDGGSTQDANGAHNVPPVSSGPAPDAAPGSAAPQAERDAGTATVPPGADARDAAAVAAADAASPATQDAGPPPKCGGGPVNACGGCEVLGHQPDESCSNGGSGLCDRPGTYRCLGEVTVCSAPPPMPGVETCDGIDNDCDGQIDNGVLNACKKCGDVPVEVCDGEDNDCDGMKDEGFTLNACGGCGPTPAEICDGKDNDCDGQADEGDATDAKTWYRDCDGDGFGIIQGSIRSCAMPAPPAGCLTYVTMPPTTVSTGDCRETGRPCCFSTMCI